MLSKKALSLTLSVVLAVGAAAPAMAADATNTPREETVVQSHTAATGLSAGPELDIRLIGRYSAPEGKSAAEIVAYNKMNKKAYVINGAAKSLDILDLNVLKGSTTVNETVYKQLNYETRVKLGDLGLVEADYDMTSVAVSPDGRYVALAVPARYTFDARITTALTGKIIVLDAVTNQLAGSFDAGYLPDMVTFTPDGSKILAANEGEPVENYGDDPEGSVTVVDIHQGISQAVVTQVGFAGLDARAFDANVRFFPKGQAALTALDRAKDLEPEYIAVSPDSSYAYVVLQENNAIATLNLNTLVFEKVSGLGYKDYSLPQNKMDVSDKDDKIHIANWPVLGMYQPDGISLFEKDGITYLVTANEGDSRADYSTYNEESRVKDIIPKTNPSAKVQLDRSKFKGYTDAAWNELLASLEDGTLRKDSQLGRLNVTTSVYSVTGATYYDAFYAFGGRSFSIWDAANISAGPVYDSGGQFEQIIGASSLSNYFNASNDNINKDDRSDNKGPEPEDVKIGVIGSQTYAFVGLERMGGVMVYNVTNPAQPYYVTYYSSRDFSSAVAGDAGPEGMKFVEAYNSPTGKPLLLVGNEVSGTVAVYEVTPAETFPLTVIHTNDTHANLDTTNAPDNIARRVTAIKEAKASSANPLLIDAGDVFSGTLYFNKYEGQADLEFMNLAGYDVMTFGNHEFDKGSKVLDSFINNARFPFVSSNVNFSHDEILAGRFKDEIGKPGDAGKIYPALVKEMNGEWVGLIGLTTETTANISSPGDVTFEDAVEKAKNAVARLQAEGVNKIIAVSHLGYEVDQELAKKVEGIDIIVGGHTHTKLEEAVVDVTHGSPTIIVQTGEKGQFLGKLSAVFDRQGVLVSWNENLISVDAKNKDGSYVIAADPEAKHILDTKYKPGITALKQQVVGQSAVNLNGLRADVRTKETNLGNLIADGMLDAAKAAGTGAVVALQNGGGIRASMSAGSLTQGSVMEVLPFNNDLVTITVTGQEIRDALENGVSKVESQDGRFPHVAGMRFVYDSSLPAGHRITGVEVKDGNSYVPLDPRASYVLATNAFTAKGGDYYDSFAKAYNAGRVNLLYLPDYQVFTTYLQKLGTVTESNASVEGRITDAKSRETHPPVWPADKKLTASDVTASSVKLVWTLASDDTGVVSYAVYGNGSKLQTVAGTVYSYTAAGLASGTTYTFKVEAADAGGNVSADGPSVTVTTASSGGGYVPVDTKQDGEGTKLTPSPVSGGVELVADGKALKQETAVDGSTVQVLKVHADSLKEALSKAGSGKVLLTLPDIAGAVKVSLPATALVETAKQGGAVISVKAGGKTYDLPLKVVRVEALAASLGAEAKDVSINVSIGAVSGDAKKAVEAAAGKAGVVLLSDAVSYSITAQAGDKAVEVNGFGTVYVSRTLTLNKAADPAKATAVVYDPATGAMSFVPAVFEAVDGKTVVTIKRNSNSVYAVVQSSASFADLQNHWSKMDVELLAAKLLVNGQAADRFAPDADITRGEFAAMLARGLGFAPDASGLAGIKDASSSAWYAGAVGSAVKAGLVEGFEDGTFRPEAKITRAEMAVMISRAARTAGKGLAGAGGVTFADTKLIPAWASEAIVQSAAAGIIQGTDGARFAPEQQATRAEAAVILKRLLMYTGFMN